MKHLLRIFVLLLALLLVGCGGGTTGSPPPTQAAPISINVFAAASLTESFGEIAKQFQETHPNIKVVYNFNGSQILEQQLEQGATGDVFASADLANMKKASDAGLIGPSQVFVKNRLAVIVPTGNPGQITTLKDLAKDGIKLVLAAPAVPVGKYSLQVLDTMAKNAEYGAAYSDAVKANVVSQEENVKAVVQKVQLGEADAGIVYQTDVTAAVADKVTLLEIPDSFNVIAEYPIATTLRSAHLAEAQEFVNYVLGPDGQTILKKYRFVSVV